MIRTEAEEAEISWLFAPCVDPPLSAAQQRASDSPFMTGVSNIHIIQTTWLRLTRQPLSLDVLAVSELIVMSPTLTLI